MGLFRYEVVHVSSERDGRTVRPVRRYLTKFFAEQRRSWEGRTEEPESEYIFGHYEVRALRQQTQPDVVIEITHGSEYAEYGMVES